MSDDKSVTDEIEIVDGDDVDVSESTTDSDQETDEKGGEEDNSLSNKGAKKNQSNWKKLSKSNKQKDRQISELKAKLEQYESWNFDDEDDEDDEEDVGYGFDHEEFLEYLIDNPDAKSYKSDIKEISKSTWLSFDEALILAKSRKGESKTKKDINLGKTTVTRKKTLMSLSEKEANEAFESGKITSEQYLKYQKSKWMFL